MPMIAARGSASSSRQDQTVNMPSLRPVAIDSSLGNNQHTAARS
jgi:hypothetical protein